MRRPRPIRRPFLLGALLLTALTAAPAGAAYDESTAFQITPGHTGFASGGSLDRPPLVERWTRTLGTQTSYPLVAGGRIFVIARTNGVGTLHGLDAGTGATLWSRPVAGGAEIAYDGGRVFVSEDSGSVIAVSAQTGATQWIRTLAESFRLHKPVAADGTLYVVSSWSGGALYALDTADGSTRWTTSSGGASPGLDGSFVYVSDDYQGATSGVSRADGNPAWYGTKSCFVGSGNVVTDGARVLGPWNSGCGAVVDAATGAELDSFAANWSPAAAGEVAVSLSTDILQARNLRTGLLLWQFTGDGHLPSSPVIVNETVYVGSSTGRLYALDLRTGAQLWSGPVGPGATPGAAGFAAGHGLLVVPAGGTISAMGSARAARPGLDLRITAGPDGPTQQSTATLQFGSGSPLAPQVCRLDGGPWTACLGGVTYPALADGPHMFEVQTRDLADGSVVALAARGWSVDTQHPTATVSGGPTGPTQWTSATFQVTVDHRAARAECRLDDAPWGSCETREYYNDTEYSALADGPHRFQARARDGVGNVQPTPVTRSWTVDTTRPTTSIDSGPQGATSDRSATFTFSADEPATFRCSMDYAPSAPCQSPFAMAGVGDGTHLFTVTAYDAAGNYDYGPPTQVWSVGAAPADTTAPETYLTAAPPALTAATSAQFRFSASDNGRFECRLDLSPWSSCSSPRDVSGLTDGEHRFDIRAIDIAGNVDPTPASWVWTVDSRPPATAARLAADSGPQAGYRFAFAADESPVTYECSLDAGWYATCVSGVAYSGLVPGAHTFAVRAIDAAGNRAASPTEVAFTVGAPGGGTVALPAPAAPAARAAPAATLPAGGTAPAQPLAPRAVARLAADAGATLLRTKTRAALRRSPAVRLYSSGPATVALQVTTRRGGRTITVATARASFKTGGTRTARLRLSRAGRRELARQGRLVLRVRATVSPARGAAASASASARI